MDILTLTTQFRGDGSLVAIASNPLAQFGRRRQYLGATLLPERLVPENNYTEEAIRYKTVIANAATRYSPAQLKGGEIVGSFDVVLGHSDIARQFTGRDYDALLRYLKDAVGAVGRVIDVALQSPAARATNRPVVAGDNDHHPVIGWFQTVEGK